MMSASSHRWYVSGTGKSCVRRAAMTRNSRSTAWAPRSSLPGGCLRSTIFLPSIVMRNVCVHSVWRVERSVTGSAGGGQWEVGSIVQGWTGHVGTALSWLWSNQIAATGHADTLGASLRQTCEPCNTIHHTPSNTVCTRISNEQSLSASPPYAQSGVVVGASHLRTSPTGLPPVVDALRCGTWNAPLAARRAVRA